MPAKVFQRLTGESDDDFAVRVAAVIADFEDPLLDQFQEDEEY